MAKQKHYIMRVYFESVDIKVTAKGKVEARKKAIDKLNKKNVKTYIDKNNTYVELDTFFH